MYKNDYDTVTEAMANLKRQGYTEDFAMLTEKECIICHQTKTELSPDKFNIDATYRFEGETDPGDEMIVYAISSKDDSLKGVLVNAYGIYADNASSALVKKLDARPNK